MGEVKSVKVDNWGVFFLQKLQNFFNKTDYCDLTLQFRDNSQLKVHRLVLSACTDYFNVLEQTCEIVDDALIMPNEFQADVVVPIVNFMYTGTLEFELKMYGKLLRTAKEMNMTVLLKLLEAHRRTMENVNRQQRPPSPKGLRRGRGLMQISPQRNITSMPPQRISPQMRRTQVGGIGSTTITRTSVASINSRTQNTYDSSSGQQQIQIKQEQATSPFEQLRKGYNNNKRPAPISIAVPPAKKPNIEDVKEFAEQQRMRKQIAAEYGEDQEYESSMMMDDDIHADDDDDDLPAGQQQQPTTSRQMQVQTTQVEHGSATILFKQESGNQPPTIIVKDSSNTKLNHAKLISEVLRQYPNLIKGQKNVKLKIMPNSNQATSSNATGSSAAAAKTIIRKEIQPEQPPAPQKKIHIVTKPIERAQGISSQTQTQNIQKSSSVQKISTNTTTAQSTVTEQAATTPAAQQAATGPTTAAQTSPVKRRIDSKTMHALIALGAENTTGPWLCLRCGLSGRPISIPSYRGFRRHLINTHKETIDPALCEHCGWRSAHEQELHFHIQLEHKIKSTQYTFSECDVCSELFMNDEQLHEHTQDVHPEELELKQHCVYCNSKFATGEELYQHMKQYHKIQAISDGIIDPTDNDEYSEEEEHLADSPLLTEKESKIKILSDISLPVASSLVKVDATAEDVTLGSNVQELLPAESATVSAGIPVTNENEVKFVGVDGKEMSLTAEQRKDLLSQLSHDGNVTDAVAQGVVMIFNDDQPVQDENKAESVTDTKSAAGTEESLGDDEINEEGDADASSVAEDYDDSQIYEELNTEAEREQKKNENAQLDESKESAENLEWAENLISAQEELGNEAATSSNLPSQAKGANPKLTDKLKELTCDWSEDDNDDDIEAEGKNVIKEKESIKEQADAAIIEKDESKVSNVKEDEDEDEDDIELALENLHKESEPIEKAAPVDATKLATRKQSSEANEPAIASEKTSISKVHDDKKMDVDEKEVNLPELKTTVVSTVVAEDDIDEILEMKQERNNSSTEREFIKVTPKSTATQSTESKPSSSKEQSSKLAAGEHEQLETESMRRTLLDELIAEADKIKDIENDEESELEAEELTETEQDSETKESSEIDQHAKDVKIEKKIIDDSDTEKMDIKETEEKKIAQTKDNATAESEEVLPGQNTQNASEKGNNNNSGKQDAIISSAVSSDAKSAAKVKSIISEWVDDDDEDDDFNEMNDELNESTVADENKLKE